MFSYVTLPTVYEMARFLLIFYNSDLLFLQIYWLKFYSEKHHNHHQRNFFFNFLNLTGFGASQSLSTLNSIMNLLFSKPEAISTDVQQISLSVRKNYLWISGVIWFAVIAESKKNELVWCKDHLNVSKVSVYNVLMSLYVNHSNGKVIIQYTTPIYDTFIWEVTWLKGNEVLKSSQFFFS